MNGSTPVWGQTFVYDIYNNVTKTVLPGQTGITWAPGYNAINNRYTLAGTTYSTNGNLLTDTFHTYTWNQDNHPKSIDAVTMIYDAFGRMVEGYNGSYFEKLQSPVGEVAVMAGQTIAQYRVPLPGGSTAISVPGAIYYEHSNNLGSAPFVSARGTRTPISTRLFAPYGESYNITGNTGFLDFTGDWQDLVAGTYDTPNRELNPTQGRWLSPDPAGASWNAYQYSTNPMSETDPSGLNEIRIDGFIATGWSISKNGLGLSNFGWADKENRDAGADPIAAIMNAINGVVTAVFRPEIELLNWAFRNWSLFQPFVDNGMKRTYVKVGWFVNTPLNPDGHIALGVGDNPLVGLNPASDAEFVARLLLYEVGCVGGVACNPLAMTVVPGAILPQDPSVKGEEITIPIHADQGIAIQTAIGLSMENPPNYSIEGNLPACDCGTWAQQMLRFGGIDSGPPAWNPAVMMDQLHKASGIPWPY